LLPDPCGSPSEEPVVLIATPHPSPRRGPARSPTHRATTPGRPLRLRRAITPTAVPPSGTTASRAPTCQRASISGQKNRPIAGAVINAVADRHGRLALDRPTTSYTALSLPPLRPRQSVAADVTADSPIIVS